MRLLLDSHVAESLTLVTADGQLGAYDLTIIDARL